jgi:hypothetical protein
MTAYYPGNIKNDFTVKVDGTDVIYAAHPNLLQDEVYAIENVLGVNPHISTAPSSGGTYSNSVTTYANLVSRLANIEQGIVADTHTQYMKLAGGSTITTATSATKGLVIKGAASQTANLQEWQNSSGTILAYIDAAGNLQDQKVAVDSNSLFVQAIVFG